MVAVEQGAVEIRGDNFVHGVGNRAASKALF
jgi:hypothetical protein